VEIYYSNPHHAKQPEGFEFQLSDVPPNLNLLGDPWSGGGKVAGIIIMSKEYQMMSA
jgi:hypothetical protein